MRKFYTPDHQRVTTCHEFEIKFHDFLNYLQREGLGFYDTLSQNVDFKIDDMSGFRNIFVSFFSNWLTQTYKYDQSKYSINDFINSVSRVSEHYGELFAYHNLYKFLDSTTLFIYDITLNDTEESFLRGIKGKNILYTKEALQKATCSQIVEKLKNRDFLDVSNDELVLTFKGRQAV